MGSFLTRLKKHLHEKCPGFDLWLYSSLGCKAASWELSKTKLFQKCLSGEKNHHQNQAFQQYLHNVTQNIPTTSRLAAS